MAIVVMATEADIYSILGETGFATLVGHFYRRVKGDDLLGPLYPQDDFENAEIRLREFLIQRFGGPDRYSRQRGHPRLRMRHAPFPIDLKARNRWMELMAEAMSESNLTEEVATILRKYFNDTATAMINRDG
jgi:hemoglobin